MPKTILVVENELRGGQLIAHLLRKKGYEVDEADDGVSALEILEKKVVDLLVVMSSCRASMRSTSSST